MKKLKLVAFLLAGIAITVASCSKGTQGPAGARGPAGPDSVYHSAWVTLAMTISGTQANGTVIDTFYGQTVSATKITQRILDSGLILTYLAFTNTSGGTNVVNASPYFNPEIFLVGSISLNSVNADWSGYGYRYVVIPGSILTTNSILKNLSKDQLKAVDYATVSKALNLSDLKNSN